MLQPSTRWICSSIQGIGGHDAHDPEGDLRLDGHTDRRAAPTAEPLHRARLDALDLGLFQRPRLARRRRRRGPWHRTHGPDIGETRRAAADGRLRAQVLIRDEVVPQALVRLDSMARSGSWKLIEILLLVEVNTQMRRRVRAKLELNRALSNGI